MESEHLELQQLVLKRSAALVAGDVETMSRILGDDFTYIDAGGNTHDKTEYLADYFSVSDVKWVSQDVDNITIRVYGETAVVTCRVHDTATFGSTPYDVWLRSTFVYVRHDGDWRCVSGQSTRISA